MDVSEMTANLSYSETIGSVRKSLYDKRMLEKKERETEKNLYELREKYTDMIDAQKLLSTVSDENTEKTLDYITSVVNKVLSELFRTDTPRIELHKKLYASSKPNINVQLIDGEGNVMDVNLQSGEGLRQVVSFMYAICLIEIRKGRRVLILDERLNGLHKEAKRLIQEIIKIFAKSGFQFIFVEYGLNNIGKIYNVEKRGNESTIVSLDGKDYDETKIYVDEVDLDAMDKNYNEDEEAE